MEKELKKVKIQGIAGIDKCVGEFEVWGVEKIPYPKFKVKVLELSNGRYEGHTDLEVIDVDNDYYGAIMRGETIEEALEKTINYFIKLVSKVDNIDKSSFSYIDYSEF